MKNLFTSIFLLLFSLPVFSQTPEIDIRGNSISIADGSTSANTADHTDFGSIPECSGTIVRTFVIHNIGTDDLHISALAIVGAAAGDFSITGSPAWTIAPSTQTSIQITFDPSASGSRDASLIINNDDADENPFDFAIRGTGNADLVAPVLYNLSSVANSNAAATAYSDGWQSGDNDGAGFGAWTLNASTGNTTQAGFVTGSSTTNGTGADVNSDGDINTSGTALGMYANSAQATQATRSLLSPLATSNTLRLEFDNGNVDNGQIVGFQMQNAAGLSLGEVRFRGNQPGYELVDNNGITAFASIPFTDEGIIIEVTPTISGQSLIKLTRKVNGATQTLTSVLFAGGGDQVIRRIMIFNSNAGSGTTKYLYVNNIQVLVPATGCPINISASNSTGTCGATVVYNTIIATDNCSASLPVTQTAGLPSGSVFPVGTTINSFTATDGSGNTSSCSFSVIVSDTTDPTASCRNITLYLGASGNANIIPIQMDNGSTDNCGIATRALSQTSFNCVNLGPNNVTFTVTDAAGNSSFCVGVVTVLDSTRPAANCQNLTAYLNASGNISVNMMTMDNGSTDNCGITSWEFDCDNDGQFDDATESTPTRMYNCSNVGTQVIRMLVKDATGNSRVCSSMLTITDTVRPVAIAQNLSVILSGGTATVSAPSVDNGSSDACGISSMSVTPGTFSCSNLGVNTVTLTVTDMNGNTSSTTAVVTVLSDFTSSITK